jgi:hypothetical protein
MTRYRTLWALNASKRSRWSFSMGCDAFHRIPASVGLFAHLRDCIKDFSVRPTAPGAVGFRSGFFVGGEFAEGLFHRNAHVIIPALSPLFGRCPPLLSNMIMSCCFPTPLAAAGPCSESRIEMWGTPLGGGLSRYEPPARGVGEGWDTSYELRASSCGIRLPVPSCQFPVATGGVGGAFRARAGRPRSGCVRGLRGVGAA